MFDGRSIPEKARKNGGEPLKIAEKESRILVTGSSQMVLDPIVQVVARLHRAGDIAANQAFILNTVDWLVREKDLIAIRAKGVENPRLKEISPGKRNAVKYVNILAWPLLFILAGVLRWAVRSRRSKTVEGAVPSTNKEKPKTGR